MWLIYARVNDLNHQFQYHDNTTHFLRNTPVILRFPIRTRYPTTFMSSAFNLATLIVLYTSAITALYATLCCTAPCSINGSRLYFLAVYMIQWLAHYQQDLQRYSKVISQMFYFRQWFWNQCLWHCCVRINVSSNHGNIVQDYVHSIVSSQRG